MIKFEFCETSASRNAAAEAKTLSPAVAAPDMSEIATSADDGFSLEMEEQGMTGKARRGRAKKSRVSAT